MGKLTKRSLRAMRDRWQRDLDRLEAAFPVPNWGWDNPEIETIRNLATAIAQIDGIITNQTIFPAEAIVPNIGDLRRARAALGGQSNEA